MSLLRLYFERSAAHETVQELGNLGLVQFVDLNHGVTAFARSFSGNVRLCGEMERRLRFLHGLISSEPALEPALSAALADTDTPAFASHRETIRLDDLDQDLAKREAQFLQMNEHWSELKLQQNQLVELRNVLRYGALFYSTAPAVGESSYGSVGLLAPDSPGSPLASVFGGSSASSTSLLEPGASSQAPPAQRVGSLLNCVAGVIATEKVPTFERVCYRATRGNVHARFAEVADPLVDPASGEVLMKSVFMLFFSGTEVKTKVSKICQAFDATQYPFPEDDAAQLKASAQCEERLADLGTVIDTTAAARTASLREVSGMLPFWTDKVVREKSIYHTLNQLNYDTSNALFIAEVWAPTFALPDVSAALEVGRRRSQAQVPSILEERTITKDLTPPTYFKTNKFTQVFQDIVESYGVAEYHEVNPAPFTVITFPFLFAVMFGDIGHGFVMFLGALYVVLNEKRMNRRKLNEFMIAIYDGRYMLLLMGIFSIFTGAIYNEFFAVPLDLFTSRWKFTEESVMACGIDNCSVPGDVKSPIAPYPFGFDPVWKGSQTGLVFFNSYKMKLSIVLGVCQMVLGIVMSYKNAEFHRKPLDVWYIFVPQLIFMSAIFGYLVIIILLKWAIDWDSPACRASPTCIAPDLKTVLINMFMAPGSVPAEGQLYPGQAFIQLSLLLLALCAVPWMLFPKPFILLRRHNEKKKDAYRPLMDDGESQELLATNGGGNVDVEGAVAGDHGDDDDLSDFNFSEMFVNQMIHTIEFVLGAVSNTASYLRLWALSLAHAELADVFLEKLLYMTIESGSSILMVIGFFMWAGLTVGVLLFMESLSAFLHALRLHWVEFQNKFYNLHGDGKKFLPFHFNFAVADEFVAK